MFVSDLAKQLRQVRKATRNVEQRLKSTIKALKTKISTLETKYNSLRRQNQQLCSKKRQTQIVHQVLKDKLTVPKLNCLIKGTKRPRRWSQKDIVDGLVLRSFSKRAYQFLRKKNLLPLPGLTTLRNWVRNFRCMPGIQTDILRVLEGKLSGELPDHYNLAVLSFDEMALKKVYEYHHREDQVFGPSAKVQLAVLRGLVHKWKMPVYYDFDATMTKDLLSKIIIPLEAHGARIVAIAADLGNHQLVSELKLSPENPCFPNPADPNRLVYFFPDVPHLLKLIRNHLLDQVSFFCSVSL